MPSFDRYDGHPRPGGGGRFLCLLLLALASTGLATADKADSPSAEEILRRSEEVRNPVRDYVADFELTVDNPHTRWKQRQARYTMIAHGKDHSLVLMREPKQFHPGTLLIERGRYWLLLPRSSKQYQLSSRHVINGDIANGDLARSNLIYDYTPELLGEETVDGEPCWLIELQRRHPLSLYRRLRLWASKEDYRPVKFEYYGQTNALLKTAIFEDYRAGALGTRAMRVVVHSNMRKGETTTMTFSELREFDASGIRFLPGAMIEFRDAALKLVETHDRQPTVEEIVELLGNAPGGP
ncbi:MAG: outer membrane lipoprotein-sorting protein [bacterium]|nr:outer membrane lipoprotein-sorting protein [bacterium]